MLLIKILFWLVLYPFGLFGYMVMSIFEMGVFLFHSPVDIWNIISKAVDNIQEEPAQE